MNPRSLLIPGALALIVLAAPLALAQSGPNEQITATYSITFRDVLNPVLDGDVSIEKVIIDGEPQTVSQIRTRYAQLSASSPAQAESYKSKMLANIESATERNLATAFPDASSRTVESLVLDESTLASGSSSPTIDLTVRAAITLDEAAVGLGDFDDDAIAAAFDAGAVFTTDMVPVADPGYDVTYRLTPPDGLAWSNPTRGDLATDGRLLSFTIENKCCAIAESFPLSVDLSDPSAEVATREDVQALVQLAIPDFKLQGKSLPLDADILVELYAVSVTDRFPDAIPPKVKLEFVTAGGLRALRDAGVVTQAQLDESEAQIQQELTDAIAGPLGAGAVVTGGFDDASFAPTVPPAEPARYRAFADGGYALDTETENEDVGSVFEAGAAIETSFTLTADAGRVATYTLTIPDAVEFRNATEDGVVSADGHTVTWTLSNVNGAEKLSRAVAVTIYDRDATSFTEEKATLNIVVDIKDLDITVAKAAGGDFGNLLIDVSVAGNLGVVKIPDDVKAKLPASVKLDYLSADAIRVMYRDGLIDEEQLGEIESTLVTEMQQRIGDALGGTPEIKGGLDRASLDASGVTGPFSGDNPILFAATLSIVKPLQESGSGANAQAAIALYTQELPLDLPRVEGLDTVYKVLLPKGLAVTSAKADEGTGSVETGRENGRDYFLVTPTSDERPAHVVVQMAVTPTFVLAKFWPVVLAAVLVLVLIIATPIALIVRGRRKRRGAKKA